MKKLMALLLALIMVIAMGACGDTKTPPAPTPAPTQAPTATQKPAAWPNGDITILCGNAAGSLNDVGVRAVGDWITHKTGVTAIVENNDVGGGANLITKLAKAKPDGQTLMYIGVNTLSNFYQGIWSLSPADWSKFKIVSGAAQPYPKSGCMVLTQADSPYSTWEELAAYAEAHPGEVTVASIPGKIMDIKMKALFNGTGVTKNIRWVSTTNADATAGLLGDIIDCIMLDEYTALSFLREGKSKALINARIEDDYFEDLYEKQEDIDLIRTVPTLVDVFGDEAEKYMVANISCYIVPAATPDEICEQIREVIHSLAEETEGEWWTRQTAAGGSSRLWPDDIEVIKASYDNAAPIIEEIIKMG